MISATLALLGCFVPAMCLVLYFTSDSIQDEDERAIKISQDIERELRELKTRKLMEAKLESIRSHQKTTIVNCKNCGAPISGVRCDYCGTVFS